MTDWPGHPVPGPPGPSPSTPPGPPGPPPGPGVQPPFVAAPIEGRRARTWLGLGVAGAVLLACCGVGAVAVGGLLVLGQQAVNEQAQRAVTDYLAAVAEQDWSEAYDLRCDADRQAESQSEFTDRVSAQPAIEAYRVGDIRIEAGGGLDSSGEFTVPAEVTYAGGGTATLIFPVEQNTGTGPDAGRFEVCGQVRPG